MTNIDVFICCPYLERFWIF